MKKVGEVSLRALNANERIPIKEIMKAGNGVVWRMLLLAGILVVLFAVLVILGRSVERDLGLMTNGERSSIRQLSLAINNHRLTDRFNIQWVLQYGVKNEKLHLRYYRRSHTLMLSHDGNPAINRTCDKVDDDAIHAAAHNNWDFNTLTLEVGCPTMSSCAK